MGGAGAPVGGQGLGVTMFVEDDAVLVRNEWVRPCDFRLTFARDFTYG